MAKKSLKNKSTQDVRQNMQPSGVDYDKLADAIVRAHKTIEDEKREKINAEMEKWRKTIGFQEYPKRPIKQFCNDVGCFYRMATMKREDATTGKATYSLLQFSAGLTFSVIKFFLYALSLAFLIVTIRLGIDHNWIRMGTDLMCCVMMFVLARMFRIAGFEIENMRDRAEILAITSTTAAMAALIIAVFTLLVEVVAICMK